MKVYDGMYREYGGIWKYIMVYGGIWGYRGDGDEGAAGELMPSELAHTGSSENNKVQY